MKGVDILNIEEISAVPLWVDVIGIIAVMVFAISLIILLISVYKLWNVSFIVSIITTLISFIFIIILGVNDIEEPTGRYRYEATIDDSVSITEVYDRYKVVERRDDIWILEDKEEDKEENNE